MKITWGPHQICIIACQKYEEEHLYVLLSPSTSKLFVTIVTY